MQVCHELKYTQSEVMNKLTYYEFYEWLAYFKVRNERMEEAAKSKS